MRKLKVYIAGPISGKDQMDNIGYAIRVADTLLDNNYMPFIPHLASFWQFHSSLSYKTLTEYGIEWLRVCDAVFRLEGDSPGADKEVAFAMDYSIPVFHDMIPLNEWRDSK